MKNYDNIYEMLAPSRFRAVIDEEKYQAARPASYAAISTPLR
jgi:hypothetical protein